MQIRTEHKFANAQFLKHFAQVSELSEPTAKDAQVKVKPADKMLMLQHCSMVKTRKGKGSL